MSARPDSIHVTLLLADAAQVVAGKLYILGGAWNITGPGGSPINMGLAINIRIPWNETNQRHKFRAVLLTEDGQGVKNPNGEDIFIEAEFEMGRPPGLKPGVSFNAPFAIQMNQILAAGGYRWEASIDGTLLAAESFTVSDRPVQQAG
jgi:hypothetical protein